MSENDYNPNSFKHVIVNVGDIEMTESDTSILDKNKKDANKEYMKKNSRI